MSRPHVPDPSNPVLAVSTQAVLLYGIGALCVQFWLTQVGKTVHEPYLDEVFHIPQAQAYWAGSWRTWDPKITTPPGLYIYSYFFAKLLAIFGKRELSVCLLRTSISVLLMLTPIFSLQCHPRYHKYQNWSSTLFVRIVHTNLNIILCPLLFFFSALYYTDVLSAFAVLEVYRWYVYMDSEEGNGSYLLSRLSADARSMICGIAIFLLGLYAMLVRQTNVFWVAVFLGGLRAVKTLSSRTRPSPLAADQQATVSINAHVIYDPPMRDSGVEGT
jgi:alpha-1,2-glucosyltransferase